MLQFQKKRSGLLPKLALPVARAEAACVEIRPVKEFDLGRVLTVIITPERSVAGTASTNQTRTRLQNGRAASGRQRSVCHRQRRKDGTEPKKKTKKKNNPKTKHAICLSTEPKVFLCCTGVEGCNQLALKLSKKQRHAFRV
ncbi:hypothetical protein PoB_005667400 [Plakobranchus ocellatus]|uniref:Uncharacterized protein n=1 Tax=Plakobranchus ocellatus TaxID=259542 RepID=A0AAV4CC52_9GAST|nr:hypothetical protein PoB_005667400 [Plakobranchus ocellatus]